MIYKCIFLEEIRFWFISANAGCYQPDSATDVQSIGLRIGVLLWYHKLKSPESIGAFV